MIKKVLLTALFGLSPAYSNPFTCNFTKTGQKGVYTQEEGEKKVIEMQNKCRKEDQWMYNHQTNEWIDVGYSGINDNLNTSRTDPRIRSLYEADRITHYHNHVNGPHGSFELERELAIKKRLNDELILGENRTKIEENEKLIFEAPSDKDLEMLAREDTIYMNRNPDGNFDFKKPSKFGYITSDLTQKGYEFFKNATESQKQEYFENLSNDMKELTFYTSDKVDPKERLKEMLIGIEKQSNNYFKLDL